MTNYQDDISALATPLGESALAIIRTSGSGCIQRIARCFSHAEKLMRAPGHSIVYGWIVDGDTPIDEVTLGVFHAPHSYTGEDSVEIYCHGSIPGIEKIMQGLFSLGFRQAQPGEFTLRAFLNKKIDLTRAEAVQELIHARSLHAQSLAVNRLSGGVFDEIDRIKWLIADIMATVSVQLDYPDEELPISSSDSLYMSRLISQTDINAAIRSLKRLSESYHAGRLYQEGVRIVLAGRTNSGKSRLFNLFLKEDRAIVSEVHGTTRDYLEAPGVLDGIPIRLFDTAGFRNSDELIEQEGIRRSDTLVQNSSIVIYLVDGSCAVKYDEHLENIQKMNVPCIKVWTKTDLAECQPAPEGFLPLSSLRGDGFADLQEKIKSILMSGIDHVSESDVLIDSLRQKELIDRAIEGLDRVNEGYRAGQPFDGIAFDLQCALQALGEITGEVSSEKILDRIFSTFCVGK